jgi:hypothetical protein
VSESESGLDYQSKDAEEEAHGPSARADESVTGANSGDVDDVDAQQAAEGLTVSARDAAAYRESLERGAAQKGEGAAEF